MSGAVGLAIVAVAALVHMCAATPLEESRASRVLPRATLPLVTGLAGMVGAISAAGRFSSGLHSMAFNGVVDGLIALAAGLLIMTVAWHVGRQVSLRAT